MGRTLNLVDHLLTTSRQLLERGQAAAAQSHLTRLTRLSDLPNAIMAEIQHLLGDTCLRLGQFRQARQHLRSSLRLVPENPQAHYELARAIENDAKVDAAKATAPYRRAVELAPHEPRFLADAGAHHVQMGRPQSGLPLLFEAVELAPDDLGILRLLVEMLCESRQFDDAVQALRNARFRHRTELEIDQLLDRVQFHRTRDVQRVEAEPAPETNDDEPVLLPFNAVDADAHRPVRRNKYRRDAGSKAQPHLNRYKRQFDTGRSG